MRRASAAGARHARLDPPRERLLKFEITTLLIPGLNDSDAELRALTAWVARELGPDVPLHFTAFHPDWKMQETPATPRKRWRKRGGSRSIRGLHHVYTGNVPRSGRRHDALQPLRPAPIVRDWYEIRDYALTPAGHCPDCGTPRPDVSAAGSRLRRAPGTDPAGEGLMHETDTQERNEGILQTIPC